jgi:succinate dehydrogenase / fumarate reductase flavoprotein subunit
VDGIYEDWITMKKKIKIIVIGGGLGGLWATIRIAEAGYQVKLFSLFEVKRSHSACAQGGINACLNTKGQQDTVWQHIADTIKGGDYLANQPPVKSMCEQAPGLIYTFDRMGVTFSRTPEGYLDLRLFGGVKNRRTVFAGSSTGQQLLYACDEQVRKHEAAGTVKKFEWWEFLSIVTNSKNECKGIVAMNLNDMSVHSFQADAVILATGGLCRIYGQSTNSTNSSGAAASRVFQQGAHFINGEFIQFHPSAIPGDDKNRLMSEAARGEGGRIWVPKRKGDTRILVDIPESDRWFFLEDTVPRDIASRAIWKVIHELDMGIDGKVCLDLTHKDEKFLRQRLGSILELYKKFVGVDPYKNPLLIAPSAHYSMGGLWVDWEIDKTGGGIRKDSPQNHATNIPGLFACGECDGMYHGANRLGANSLLSASFSGKVAGDSVISYCKGLALSASDEPKSIFESELKRQNIINTNFQTRDGKENPFIIHKELGQTMTNNIGIVRDNISIDKAIDKIQELKERSKNLSLNDNSTWTNSSLPYARMVSDMIVIAEVIARSARKRDECRGSHYKPEFEISIPEGKSEGDPEFEVYKEKWNKNNEKWLKTTVASLKNNDIQLSYTPVDTTIIKPTKPRDYR